MKHVLILALMIVAIVSCKRAQIEPTDVEANLVPWNDTSYLHPKNAAFRDLIETYRKKGLPGISLLVNDADGTWVGATGKADIENDVDFGVAQVAKAASITKLFVGTLVFKLFEDSVNSGLGYNALHQPVATWIPSYVIDKIPNWDNVTLGQCMKHETGIPDVIDQNAFYLEVLNNPNKKWDAEELLQYVNNTESLFEPGDTASYSNTNTILVALVIEHATGKKHNELLKQFVTNPLGLQHTFYQPHDQLPTNTAQGYYDLYNNNTIVNVSNLVTGSGNGYGGLFSNVFDLFTFANALLVDQTMLSTKSLNMMQTFGAQDGVNRYGYGIMKKFVERGDDAGLGHSGRDLGYSANMFYHPNMNVMHVFFVNYGTDAQSNLRQVFLDFQEELLDLTLQ